MIAATAAWIAVGTLGLFALWRLWVLIHAFRAPRPEPQSTATLPEVVVLAPMRNEERRAPILLAALDRLNYPKVRIVVGDDASLDGTADLLRAWARDREQARVYESASPVGKGGLLNAMLAGEAMDAAPFLAVYDAKHGPAPDSLRRLVEAMADPRIGCASGLLEPANARAGLVARYAALEAWVTQLIQHEGRERSGFSSPSLGGNCVYRRIAVEEAGGFAEGSFSEDTEMSLAMQAAGWRTRFVATARCSNRVVETPGALWNQRTRWNHGIRGAVRRARRVSGWMTGSAYLDRLALLSAFGLAWGGALPWWVPAGYCAIPLLLIAGAVVKADAVRELPAIGLAVAVLAPLDVAVTVWAAVGGVLGRSPSWR